ncbi:hypothetical protein ACOMHN_059929 [Nucella lapillus]
MTAVEPFAVDVSEDGTLASLHLKQLAYDNFGSAGRLHPHKVSRLFEMGRVHAAARGLMDSPELLTEDQTYFILGLNYTFNPALWSVQRGETFPHKFYPPQIETQLMALGRSSATMQSRLVNSLDSKTLAMLDFKYVFVDRHTRRAVPMPDWVLEKYRWILKEKQQQPLQLSRESPEVPSSAFMYTVRVSESDTDLNQHTNQATYLQYCCDATHATVREGRLPVLQPSPWCFPLMKLQARHTGETFMGENLRVFLWQQDGRKDTIHYVIKKETTGQDTVVFYATMVYGPQSHL